MNIDVRIDDVFFNFAYVPVYVHTYQHHKKLHKIYVSGTTGKTVGKPPKSIGGFFKRVLKFFGVIALTALILYYCL